jgi:hypothetical protein
MPSSTQRQRKFIFAKRRQYGSPSRTPERWRWVWGPEWERLAEGRIVGPWQHALLEAAEGDPGYRPHPGDDFIRLATRATEPLSSYDRKVISAALEECFTYHKISSVKYRSWAVGEGDPFDVARFYDVWCSNLGGSRKEFWLSKTEDDWFWVSTRFTVHYWEGSVMQLMPTQWRCDGNQGVADLIRQVFGRSI